MKKTVKTKLAVPVQTIRVLETSTLRDAAGGAINQSDNCRPKLSTSVSTCITVW